MAKNEQKQQSSGFVYYSHAFNTPSVWHLKSDYGESNTDISTYKPDVAITRAFLGSPGNFKKRMLYDFPDGKDTGSTVQTFLRSKGLDITEVETAEKFITQIVRDKNTKAELDANELAQYNAFLDALKAKGSESSSSGEQTASTPQ